MVAGAEQIGGLRMTAGLRELWSRTVDGCSYGADQRITNDCWIAGIT